MVNRGAVILKYKDPAVSWINDADPVENTSVITKSDVNLENTVYLISNDDCDGEDAVSDWVRVNFKTLFENELNGWYTDESLWPKKRTYKIFQEWFDIEYHSVIMDTVGDEIYDDEI